MVTVTSSKVGQSVRFSVMQYETWKVRFAFTDVEGKAVDISAATAVLWIKKYSTSRSYDFELKGDDLVLSGNTLSINQNIEFSRSRYYYELQLTLDNFRFTAVYGYIAVQRSTIDDVQTLAANTSIGYSETPVQLNLKIASDMADEDMLYYTATGNENGPTVIEIISPQLVGKKVLMVFRPGILYPIESGTPNEQQFLFDSTLGKLTLAASTPLKAGDIVPIHYTNA